MARRPPRNRTARQGTKREQYDRVGPVKRICGFAPCPASRPRSNLDIEIGPGVRRIDEDGALVRIPYQGGARVGPRAPCTSLRRAEEVQAEELLRTARCSKWVLHETPLQRAGRRSIGRGSRPGAEEWHCRLAGPGHDGFPRASRSSERSAAAESPPAQEDDCPSGRVPWPDRDLPAPSRRARPSRA